jgi:hypothetical protein
MNELAKPPSSLVAKLSSVPQAFVFIAKKINEIIDRNQPLKAGTGITITESETSRLISLDSSIYGEVSGGINGNRGKLSRAPWFLTGQIEAGPTAKIYIQPGMVNSFVPTIGGTSMAAYPRPSITVTGATGIIELKATIDGAGTITALIAQNVTTASTDTSTNKYKTLGTWTASGGVFTSVTSILNTNQTFRLCNGTAEWY